MFPVFDTTWSRSMTEHVVFTRSEIFLCGKKLLDKIVEVNMSNDFSAPIRV